MTTENSLTIVLIISGFIAQLTAPLISLFVASRMSRPKPTPKPNQPKNRIQRIGGAFMRLLQSPWTTPPAFVLLNIYELLKSLRGSSPVTREVVLAISMSVAGIFISLLNFSILSILQTSRIHTETISLLSQCDLVLSDAIKHLVDTAGAPKESMVAIQPPQTEQVKLRKLLAAIKRLFIEWSN